MIFNTIVEGKDYFTLTKADSNKISYIKDGGLCQFFDGRDRHFSSTAEILEATQVEILYNKLARLTTPSLNLWKV